MKEPNNPSSKEHKVRSNPAQRSKLTCEESNKRNSRLQSRSLKFFALLSERRSKKKDLN